MQKTIYRTATALFVFIFLSKNLSAQPSNNDCANAILLTSSTTCINTAGDAANATYSGIASSCAGTVRYDVWYKFVAASTNPTITLSSVGANFNSPKVEIFSGTCAGLTSLGCAATSITASGLSIGSTYYVRALSTNNPIPTSNATFNICITDPVPPSNDDCSNATLLNSATTCSNTSGTLAGATASSPAVSSSCAGTPGGDVWYSFVAQSVYPTISLSSIGSSFSSAGVRVQLLSGSCGSFTSLACVSGSSSTLSLSTMSNVSGGLTVGNTYYIRVYSPTTLPAGANWTFNICVTNSPSLSRMNEIFKPTILSGASVLNTAWEVTYGPDDYLWITENKGYKAYRMDPNTGVKTTILDISFGSASSELTSGEHTTFNVQFPSTQSPWPQGGFAGLAIHPQFNSGKPYIYISYVRKYDSASVITNGGYYFKNNLVRFTYNSSTGKLESPVALCDTLPGSNDHNSQRLIIVPVSGTYYLFYAQGDMGAGQLQDQWRPNKAQNPNSYEGKILRFNLEPDGDSDPYQQWIPNDNPISSTSAVWCLGMRNNQGFAYDTTLGILYGSSHGPYSDDEINIIERNKNYGHPLVIGYADGNYNGSSAGSPNQSSTIAVITDEVAAAAAIPNYKDPLYAAYAKDSATIHNIWTNNPSNSTWPSEAWSGMDIYKHTLIPGWKNSLVLCSLKWGRVVRFKLGASGTSIVQTNGADTVAYFGGQNRYRDLAFAPNGKDIFVSMEGSTTSGPASNNLTVPNCTNCVIKYTFLGYADAGGKSSIPDAIDITTGTANSCTSGTTITIDNSNNNLWVPITGPDGNIMAEIYPNGNNLGTVTSSFYTNTGSIRVNNGLHYLDRNITITPQFQPTSTVKIRLYISQAEFNALKADPLSGVNVIGDLKIYKNSDACGAVLTSTTTLINPTYAEAHGIGGYMLQGNISSFSSFYFSGPIATLPLQLLTFTGALQNNNALLQWQTTNESGVSSFIIERSIDANNFKPIGTVPAKGGYDNQNNYSFTDYDASKQSSGSVYYRLRMVDVDGSIRYSKIISVTFNSTYTVFVYPNPVNDILNISIISQNNSLLKMQITNVMGQVVYQKNNFAANSSSVLHVNTETWQKGMYIVKITNIDNEILSTQKVLKQE